MIRVSRRVSHLGAVESGSSTLPLRRALLLTTGYKYNRIDGQTPGILGCIKVNCKSEIGRVGLAVRVGGYLGAVESGSSALPLHHALLLRPPLRRPLLGGNQGSGFRG